MMRVKIGTQHLKFLKDTREEETRIDSRVFILDSHEAISPKSHAVWKIRINESLRSSFEQTWPTKVKNEEAITCEMNFRSDTPLANENLHIPPMKKKEIREILNDVPLTRKKCIWFKLSLDTTEQFLSVSFYRYFFTLSVSFYRVSQKFFWLVPC